MAELVRGLGRERSADERPITAERRFLGLSAGRAITLAIVVCALALTLAVPLRTYVAQRGEAAQLAAQRSELDRDLALLRAERDQQNDPAFVRAEARQRLRLVQPGETPYQVQLPGEYEAEQARRAGPPPKGGPWYTDLWRTIAQPQPDPQPTTPVPAPSPPAG